MDYNLRSETRLIPVRAVQHGVLTCACTQYPGRRYTCQVVILRWPVPRFIQDQRLVAESVPICRVRNDKDAEDTYLWIGEVAQVSALYCGEWPWG
jgi:hypothetical protein